MSDIIHREIQEKLRLDLKIAVDGDAALRSMTAEELCRRYQGVRGWEEIYGHAAAVWCHELYFKNLLPEGCPESLPEGDAAEKLRQSFGSRDNFFYLVRTLAKGTSSPGFLWLYRKKSPRHPALGLARLPLYTLPDLRRFQPLWCIDLWEHAYIDPWGQNPAGFADSCLRRTAWQEIFPKNPQNG